MTNNLSTFLSFVELFVMVLNWHDVKRALVLGTVCLFPALSVHGLWLPTRHHTSNRNVRKLQPLK